MNINIESKTRRAALYLGLVLTVVLILNQGLQFYINATDTFTASMAAGDQETIDISIRTNIGRPSFLEHLLYRFRELTATWYVGGIQKTYAETGVEISITGTNIASQASVDYYIEAKASDSSGTPYRFLEGNNTAVTVGGAALDLDNQTTISAHLEAMGLSTTQSHTIDYYVYVTAEATGAVSGETLTTEITYTKFDSVTYQYGSIVTENYQVAFGSDDEEIIRSAEYYIDSGTYLTWGDKDSGSYDHEMALQFRYIEVPQGADITYAKVTFWTKTCYGSPVTKIQGEKGPTTGIYSYATFVGKERTTASVTLTSSGWGDNIWKAKAITDIVQEIVDEPDWEAGDYLVIFCSDQSLGWGGADARLRADSYEGNSGLAPKLEIRYLSYGASWYNIPPLSVVDLPVTLDVVAVLAAVSTTAFIVQQTRRRNEKWRK